MLVPQLSPAPTHNRRPSARLHRPFGSQPIRRELDSTAIVAPIELLTVLSPAFQFGKRAPGEAAEFSRGGIELLGVIGAARLERGEPAAEASELIRRQLGNSFGDFFDFHVAQYSNGEA